MTPSSAAVNLRRLLVVRAIVLVAACVTVFLAVRYAGAQLPVWPLAIIFGATLAILTISAVRLRLAWAIRDTELFAQLALDVGVLTAALYVTGGASNPFAPLYLLPLTLTAAALPGRYTWAMLGLTGASYTLLLFYYVPLPQEHAGHDFRVHVLGMWLGFLASGALIASFAVNMTRTLRERELRHQRVLTLGTLAAGAAHELGTPLSTMAVLVHDLSPKTATPEKLAILREQIERCKEILSKLASAAGETRAESGRGLAVDAYLAEMIARWRAMRPNAAAHCEFDGPQPAPRIVAEQTLSQAILAVLNNAADASPEPASVRARWTETEIAIEVHDRGPGVEPRTAHRAGREPFSTKPVGEGMGIGLFLAQAAIERFGGAVSLDNAAGRGACCRLVLPLARLKVPG